MDRTWTQQPRKPHSSKAQPPVRSQMLLNMTHLGAEVDPYFTKAGKSQGEFLKLCPTPSASSSKSIHDMTLVPQGELGSIRAEISPATKCSFPPLYCVLGFPSRKMWVFFPRTSLNFRLFPQERQTHSWSESPGSPSSRYLQDGNASSAFIKQEPLVSSSHGNSSLPMGKAWDNVPGVGKDYPSIRRKQSSSTITEQAVLSGTGEIKGINEGIGSTKKALTGAKPKHRIPGI